MPGRPYILSPIRFMKATEAILFKAPTAAEWVSLQTWGGETIHLLRPAFRLPVLLSCCSLVCQEICVVVSHMSRVTFGFDKVNWASLADLLKKFVRF